MELPHRTSCTGRCLRVRLPRPARLQSRHNGGTHCHALTQVIGRLVLLVVRLSGQYQTPDSNGSRCNTTGPKGVRPYAISSGRSLKLARRGAEASAFTWMCPREAQGHEAQTQTPRPTPGGVSTRPRPNAWVSGRTAHRPFPGSDPPPSTTSPKEGSRTSPSTAERLGASHARIKIPRIVKPRLDSMSPIRVCP